jgi:hypothetical protein
MAKRNLVLIIALLLAIPMVLVGCAKSDSAAIKDSINGFAAAYNAEDFDKCTDYLVGITDATKDAVKGSLQLGHQLGGDITVDSIEDISVDGSSATAKVTVTVMGQSFTNVVNLNKVDGKWQFQGGDLFPTG